MVLWTFTVVSEESREFHKILRLPWLGTFACKIVWVTFIRPQFLLLINPQFPVLIVAVHLLSSAQLFVIPWTAAHQASLSYTISHGLLKLMSIELVMSSNHLILCHPLLLLPSIFPSIRVFSNGLALCIRWPKYWSFSFSISPSNVYSGLISFSSDSLISLQSKGLSRVFSNITVWKHRFFGTQLSLRSNSHPHMTTGKTIALTRQNFVSKVISLLYNTLSRLVIAFLPRSKCLLISWLWSPSAVILGPKY